MRTTYGSPLFAEHVPEHDSLLVERLRAAGAIVIGKTNTPEFGAGSQTFNARLRRHPQPVRPDADARRLERRRGGRRRGRDGAVRRRLRPRRERPQPGLVLQPRRPAPLPRPDSGRRAGRSVEPVRRCSGRSRARRATPRCCSRARRAGPARSALDRASRSPSGPGLDPRGLRIAWSRDLGGLPVEPEVTAVLETRRGDAGGSSAASSRTPSRTSRGADECFEVLRGVGFAGAFAEHRRRGQADAGREHPLRALRSTPPRIARGARLRGELFTRMREFLTRYDALAAPVTQVAPFAVEVEYPTLDRRRRDGHLPRVVPVLLADHGHVASVDRRARPASPTTGLPIGLQLVGRHRGEADAAAARAGVHRGDRARARSRL